MEQAKQKRTTSVRAVLHHETRHARASQALQRGVAKMQAMVDTGEVVDFVAVLALREGGFTVVRNRGCEDPLRLLGMMDMVQDQLRGDVRQAMAVDPDGDPAPVPTA